MRIHWTLNLHAAVAIAYPVGLMLFNGAHDQPLYRRWLLKQSSVEADDDFIQKLDTQIHKLSERRFRPLRTAKFSVVTIDRLESDTLGAFYTISTGAFFKFSSRLMVSDASELVRVFPNLASMESRLGQLSVQSADLDVNALKGVLFTDDAKNFVLARELLRADSGSDIWVNICTPLMIFIATLPVLNVLRPLAGSIFAICSSTGLSAVTSVAFNRSYKVYSTLRWDRKTSEIDDSYAAGCKEYLQKSLALGKLLRRTGGQLMQRFFSENGDCLLYTPTYSQRLTNLEKLLEDQAKKQKNV